MEEIFSEVSHESSGIDITTLKQLVKRRESKAKELEYIKKVKITDTSLCKFVEDLCSAITRAWEKKEPKESPGDILKEIVTERTEFLEYPGNEVLMAVPALYQSDITEGTILSQQTLLIILANLFDFAMNCNPTVSDMYNIRITLWTIAAAVKEFTSHFNGPVYGWFVYTNLLDLLYMKYSAVPTRAIIQSLDEDFKESYQVDLSQDTSTRSVYRLFCDLLELPQVKTQYVKINEILDPKVSSEKIKEHIELVKERLKRAWIVKDTIIDKIAGPSKTWYGVTFKGEHICIRESIIKTLQENPDSSAGKVSAAALLIVLLHEGAHVKRFLSGIGFAFYGTPQKYKSGMSLGGKGEMGEWLEEALYGCRLSIGLLKYEDALVIIDPENYASVDGISKMHKRFAGHKAYFKEHEHGSVKGKFGITMGQSVLVTCGNQFFGVKPRSYDLAAQLAEMIEAVKKKKSSQ